MSHHDREKVKLLQRLKKLRGQLDAVERSLTADEDCGGQLMLLAAVRGGVNGLMGEVLETHIRFHLADGAKEQIAPELRRGPHRPGPRLPEIKGVRDQPPQRRRPVAGDPGRGRLRLAKW